MTKKHKTYEKTEKNTEKYGPSQRPTLLLIVLYISHSINIPLQLLTVVHILWLMIGCSKPLAPVCWWWFLGLPYTQHTMGVILIHELGIPIETGAVYRGKNAGCEHCPHIEYLSFMIVYPIIYVPSLFESISLVSFIV